MKKLATFTAVAALAMAFTVGLSSIGPANAASKKREGFGRLVEPDGAASWLVDHYDNRGAEVTGGPDFDDSAEVKFVGNIVGLGKVTVEQSAAWTFNTYAASGGSTLSPSTGTTTAPCAVVYDTSRTLVRIHKHQGVSTEVVTAGPTLTLIPGAEFPFSAAGVGAAGLVVGTHTFTGTFTVTQDGDDTITGIVEGGTNCEVASFTTVGGHPPAGVFDFNHTDTNNTVQTALEITGGTGEFAGATGIGTLSFTYDTFEAPRSHRSPYRPYLGLGRLRHDTIELTQGHGWG